ncbi:MAG: monoheme cytochrome C [Flavobacteriaceae bacterium]
MDPKEYKIGILKAEKLLKKAILLLSISTLLLLFLIYDPTLSIFKEKQLEKIVLEEEDKIENGIHIRTGLKEGKGLMTVVNNCTNCHSAKLVTQNRMNKKRWDATIKWMQQTQNLWDLGENQKVIVDYLVANYPVTEKNRRDQLTNITWYEIKD